MSYHTPIAQLSFHPQDQPVYWLNIDEDRARERIDRTFGVTTSNQVLYHLTDPRMVKEPLGRKEAHHLLNML